MPRSSRGFQTTRGPVKSRAAAMPRQQEEKGGEGPARLPAARKGRAPEGYWRSTALVCHAAKEGRGFYSGLHHATVGKRGSGGFLHNPCLRASGVSEDSAALREPGCRCPKVRRILVRFLLCCDSGCAVWRERRGREGLEGSELS